MTLRLWARREGREPLACQAASQPFVDPVLKVRGQGLDVGFLEHAGVTTGNIIDSNSVGRPATPAQQGIAVPLNIGFIVSLSAGCPKQGNPLMIGREMERRYLAPSGTNSAITTAASSAIPSRTSTPTPASNPTSRAGTPDRWRAGCLVHESCPSCRSSTFIPMRSRLGILLLLKPVSANETRRPARPLRPRSTTGLIDVWAGPELVPPARLPCSRSTMSRRPWRRSAAAGEWIPLRCDHVDDAVERAARQRARCYWPAAALDYDLPLSIHTAPSAVPLTGAVGWPSYHIQKQQTRISGWRPYCSASSWKGRSRNSEVAVTLVEGGFSWLPMAAWRMDKIWRCFRSEDPDGEAAALRIHPASMLLQKQPANGRVRQRRGPEGHDPKWIWLEKAQLLDPTIHTGTSTTRDYLFLFALTAEQQRMFHGGYAIAGLRI